MSDAPVAGEASVKESIHMRNRVARVATMLSLALTL